MEERFIRNLEVILKYERKPDTTTSFYLASGYQCMLPNRISFDRSKDGFRSIATKGRALQWQKTGEVKAGFTRNERSPYKLTSNGRIHFSLWKPEEYPFLLGFSSIGRLNEIGKIEDTNDLIVAIKTSDNCQDTAEFRIYPNLYLIREEVFKYLYKQIKN